MTAADPEIPRTPAGLRRRGRTLWRAVQLRFELAEAESALLLEACRTVDDIETLAAEVGKAPAVTLGSRGQEVVHPLRAELRSQRLLLARLLAQLDVPQVDPFGRPWDGLTASQRARKAAGARWHHRGQH